MICRRARYQTVGTRNPRCISPATNAAPLWVCAPPTTQALLPGLLGEGDAAPPARSERRSSCSGEGTGGASAGAGTNTPPTDSGRFGASQSSPRG